MVQPPPVAEFREWDVHRQATRHRMQNAFDNADNAKAKKQAGAHRALVGVFDDELRWLSNHTPADCLADDVATWSAAVEELHANSEDGAAMAKKGNKKGLKKAAKRREAAWTQLEYLAFSDPPADCPGGGQLDELPVLAGKWVAKPVYTEPGGVIDRSTRKLTIGDNGKLLIQVQGLEVCRDERGRTRTLIVKGSGEVIDDGRPGFSWLTERVDCKRKGSKQKLAGKGAEPTMLVHDAAADILLMDGNPECYWRANGGSKKDCQQFWRGTPPQPEAVAEPAEAEEITEA